MLYAASDAKRALVAQGVSCVFFVPMPRNCPEPRRCIVLLALFGYWCDQPYSLSQCSQSEAHARATNTAMRDGDDYRITPERFARGGSGAPTGPGETSLIPYAIAVTPGDSQLPLAAPIIGVGL